MKHCKWQPYTLLSILTLWPASTPQGADLPAGAAQRAAGPRGEKETGPSSSMQLPAGVSFQDLVALVSKASAAAAATAEEGAAGSSGNGAAGQSVAGGGVVAVTPQQPSQSSSLSVPSDAAKPRSGRVRQPSPAAAAAAAAKGMPGGSARTSTLPPIKALTPLPPADSGSLGGTGSGAVGSLSQPATALAVQFQRALLGGAAGPQGGSR